MGLQHFRKEVQALARTESPPDASATKDASAAPAKEGGKTLARRIMTSNFASTIVPVIVIIDASESTKPYHETGAKLVKDVIENIKQTGGERALTVVYLLVIVIAADGLKTNGWQRLGEATDVEFIPDGSTPIGGACDLAAELGDKFIFVTLIEATVRARPVEILFLTDMEATDETPEQTKAGIEKLVAFKKKARGRITLLAPAPEVTDLALAKTLVGVEGPIKYLGADPSSILRIVLNTMS